MPYIPAGSRTRAKFAPTNPGELTYALTELVREYIGETPAFADFAQVLGALEATKLEMYRRLVAPYEDLKMIQNGDVY